MFQGSALTNYALDKIISPELSKIDTCEAEVIEGGEDNLVPLLLNHTFVHRFGQNEMAFITNYVWRVDQAVDEYRTAREILIALCARKNYAPILYYKCLYHFLQSISLLYQSISLLMRFIEFTGAPRYRLFEKDDGSKEQRLNAIYNSWKHCDSRVADGELPANGSLPVWLVKSGIRSNQCELSFPELREMILDYRGNAKWFSEEPPRRIVEHRRSHAEGISDPNNPEVQA